MRILCVPLMCRASHPRELLLHRGHLRLAVADLERALEMLEAALPVQVVGGPLVGGGMSYVVLYSGCALILMFSDARTFSTVPSSGLPVLLSAL